MHERIIRLVSFEPLKFNSDEEYNEFCRALGRLMIYNLGDDREDVVLAQIDRDQKEVVATYSRDASHLTGANGWATPVQEVHSKIQAVQLTVGNLITIGAVRSNEDGKYSFHS